MSDVREKAIDKAAITYLRAGGSAGDAMEAALDAYEAELWRPVETAEDMVYYVVDVPDLWPPIARVEIDSHGEQHWFPAVPTGGRVYPTRCREIANPPGKAHPT